MLHAPRILELTGTTVHLPHVITAHSPYVRAVSLLRVKMRAVTQQTQKNLQKPIHRT